MGDTNVNTDNPVDRELLDANYSPQYVCTSGHRQRVLKQPQSSSFILNHRQDYRRVDIHVWHRPVIVCKQDNEVAIALQSKHHISIK